jgi:hypothetical protein
MPRRREFCSTMELDEHLLTLTRSVDWKDEVLAYAPAWIVEAGLPAPTEGETFVSYTQRLGLNPEPFFVELTPRTADMANGRLSSYFIRAMPHYFRHHLDARLAEYVPEERRNLLLRMRHLHSWI